MSAFPTAEAEEPEELLFLHKEGLLKPSELRITNGSLSKQTTFITNRVHNKVVCYEQVCNERGLFRVVCYDLPNSCYEQVCFEGYHHKRIHGKLALSSISRVTNLFKTELLLVYRLMRRATSLIHTSEIKILLNLPSII